MRALKSVLLAIEVLVAASLPPSLLAENLSITVNPADSQWTISPYLVGLHQVYFNVPDAEFADGRISGWAKRVGVSTSRYPGGSVVKTWDWEHPSGFFGNDYYAPDYNPSLNQDESEWMSLDEYLDFVETSGIMPMFGVNSLSGTLYNREADGIARAVRMVQYVKDRGYGGALWYIGNEEAYQHGSMAGYARVLARYGEAMKAVDPDIAIFWNQNNALSANIKDFLANDGGWIDGLETHGKWPFGGDPGLPAATFEEWQVEVPLRDRKNGTSAEIAAGGRAWRYAADNYRAIAAGEGRDILVANNEYGFGKSQYYTGFTRYTKGLVHTEMLMEHFIGNWFSACLWDLQNGTDRGVLDKANGYRFNPVHLGMNMLADCQGGEFIGTVSTDIPSVHGFAARKDDIIFIYLLNKTLEAHQVEISVTGGGDLAGFGRRMQDSADGYGELVQVAMGRGDVLLAGWDFEQDTNRDLPNYTTSGVDDGASFLQNFVFNSGTQSSSDATWGGLSLAPAPFSNDADASASISTKFRDADGSTVQDLVVKLLPGAEYTLQSLHFDYKTPFNASPKNITVSYISGLDDAETVLWQRVAAGSNEADNMDAFAGVDIDLASILTDLVLSGEETLTIRFDMSADVVGGKTGASFVDNIALVASSSSVSLPSMTFTQLAFVDLDNGAYPAIMDFSTEADGSFNLRWSSVPGAVFELERSTDLQNWTPSGEFIYPDNTWTDSRVIIDPETKDFFRIRLRNE